MQKTKKYDRVQFSAEVLKDVSRVFKQQVDPEEQQKCEHTLKVEVDNSECTMTLSPSYLPTIEELMAAHTTMNKEVMGTVSL